MFFIDISTVILIWIVCAIAAAYFATQRHLPNPAVWFVAGLVLGPIGVIASLAWSKAPDPEVDDSRPSWQVIVIGVVTLAIAVLVLNRYVG